MTDPELALVLAAAAVVLGLAAYLLVLLYRLWSIRRGRVRAAARLDERNQSMHEQRIESIELLCAAALQGDCELSEACIRIRKLLEYYPDVAEEAPGRVIDAMYQELRGFATHDDRLALSASERADEDAQRYIVEARHRDAMLESLRALKTRMEGLRGSHYEAGLRQ